MPITFIKRLIGWRGNQKVKSCSNLPTILHPINILTKVIGVQYLYRYWSWRGNLWSYPARFLAQVSTPNAVVLTARDGQAGMGLDKKTARSTRNIGVQDGLSRFKLRDLEICWNTYKYLYLKLVFIFCVFSVCLFLLFAVNAALSLRAAASEAACLDWGIEVEVHVVLLQQNVMLNGECLNVVCFKKPLKTCQTVGKLSQLSLGFSKVRFQVPFFQVSCGAVSMQGKHLPSALDAFSIQCSTASSARVEKTCSWTIDIECRHS